MAYKTSPEYQLAKQLKKPRIYLEETYYLISRAWYLKWKKHIKGGESPGIITTQCNHKDPAEDSYTFRNIDHVSVTQIEWEFLKTKYGAEEPVTRSAANEEKPNDDDSCATPRIDSSELKLPSALRKGTFRQKGNTFDNLYTSLSTTQSFKRSFSTITNLMPKGDDSGAKHALRCDADMTLLNSVLLFFFHIDSISVHFIDKYFTGLFQNKPISTLFSKLFLTKTCLKSGKIDTSFFKPFFNTSFPQFKSFTFSELFRLILDELIEEYSGHDILTKDIFNGKVLREVICLTCLKKNNAEECFNDLTLDVSVSIERSLEIFNREGRIMNYCNHCENCTSCSQRLTISQFPQYLVLTLKRFLESPYLHKNSMFSKVQKRITIDDEKYKIFSVIVHEGEIDDGKYVSFYRVNKKWYEFNEKKTSKVPTNTVFSQSVLVSVYKKQI